MGIKIHHQEAEIYPVILKPIIISQNRERNLNILHCPPDFLKSHVGEMVNVFQVFFGQNLFSPDHYFGYVLLGKAFIQSVLNLDFYILLP